MRFKANGPSPRFNDEHLDKLRDHAAGRQRIASADGVETGWAAGDSILDVNFALEKNIVNDALLFDLRVDTDKLPADLLKAYYEAEIKALAANNPSGFASAKQKREAKDSARERLEQEAKDGRFRKRKCVPVMWDSKSNEVLFGATSMAQVDRFCVLFEMTFGVGLECVTAGERAYHLAELSYRTIEVDDSAPSAFVPGVTPADVAWIADETSRDFLGNEFLLWLWYFTDVHSETIKLADGSNLAMMMARSLTLECPRGQTGHESFSSGGPTRLPESRRAIQAGKLPRKCGMTIVRHADQFEFALHAETMAIASAKLPPPPEDVTDLRGKLESRIESIRSMLEAIDGLYAAFLSKRLTKEWSDELLGMQRWLSRREASK